MTLFRGVCWYRGMLILNDASSTAASALSHHLQEKLQRDKLIKTPLVQQEIMHTFKISTTLRKCHSCSFIFPFLFLPKLPRYNNIAVKLREKKNERHPGKNHRHPSVYFCCVLCLCTFVRWYSPSTSCSMMLKWSVFATSSIVTFSPVASKVFKGRRKRFLMVTQSRFGLFYIEYILAM